MAAVPWVPQTEFGIRSVVCVYTSQLRGTQLSMASELLCTGCKKKKKNFQNADILCDKMQSH